MKISGFTEKDIRPVQDGGIASGKSTVSRQLERLGCPVIDADVVSRQVVEPDTPAWRAIIGTFGVQVLNDDRTINRPLLASMVFSDEEKLRNLNAITHPYIQYRMMWLLFKYFILGKPFVVLVSPLLYESNRFLKYIKMVIVVNCTEEQQLERLMERDILTEEEAKKRISAQMPLSAKCRRAQYVIDNSGEKGQAEQQALHLFYSMKRTSVLCGLYKWLFIIILLAVIFYCLFLI